MGEGDCYMSGILEHSEMHPYERNHISGDCGNCGHLFSEWDDMEKKQADYCCFHAWKGIMDRITKDYKCPLQNRGGEE